MEFARVAVLLAQVATATADVPASAPSIAPGTGPAAAPAIASSSVASSSVASSSVASSSVASSSVASFAPGAVLSGASACVAVCADRVAALQVPASADRWLGNDKFRHFWMSYATTAFMFAAVRAAGSDTDAALMVALPVGAVAGVGKEIHDRRRGGPFSLKDLVADALGLAAGYFLLREVQ